jgi:leader peptidase (prepilin peptidase) / N-methyltransferase
MTELLWGVLGWLAGYGLNAIVHELPRSHRLLSRPACTSCQQPLGLVALTILPVSHAAHCAGCGARVVSPASGLEIPTALLFAGLIWRHGFSAPLLVYSLFALILLVVLAIDLRHRWVYGIICYPGIILGLLLSPLVPHGLPSSALGALVGGGLFFLLYWIGRLVYRGEEPMGSGDITIATLIGTMLGVERVIPALFLGGVLVAVASLGLLLTRRASTRSFVPYGAGLCAGALVLMLLPDGG